MKLATLSTTVLWIVAFPFVGRGSEIFAAGEAAIVFSPTQSKGQSNEGQIGFRRSV